MLKLKDFFHLPEIDALVGQITAQAAGLVVVAGLDPRPLQHTAADRDIMPGGRSTMFRILLREILDANPDAHSLIVARDRSVVRVDRAMRSRVEFLPLPAAVPYTNMIELAIQRRPDLLVLDALDGENVAAALAAAQSGLRVLAQFDTVFQGAGVAHALLDLGATLDSLRGLAWVISVQRVATLCPTCKQPADPDPQRLELLHARYPALADPGAFWIATGCNRCNHEGRAGDVMVFDVFRGGADDPLNLPSALPVGEYVLKLAQQGYLALDDALRFEADQFHRTYTLLQASERALVASQAELERKRVELDTANRVLKQRTDALFSLHDLGQMMITSSGVTDLAHRICRRSRELCGADRAILYGFDADCAHVLASSGWDAADIVPDLDAQPLRDLFTGAEPTPYSRWPPGVTPHQPEVDNLLLRAGLSVPLMLDDARVGIMIFHSTRKPRFAPGEVALLTTFANQAALAIQRTQLIEQLRSKITLLEAAQAELAQKERMEHELELARQVQQSVLPHTFPYVAGYQFAAHYEPARQVGGDFYDVIALDGGHFGVAVADVSDKGMPAALYMALTRSLLLAEARRERSPRAVLDNVNTLLKELGNPTQFVTLFYGVVDSSDRCLTYARAGHDRPLLLREGAVHTLGGRGMPLSMFDDLKLSEEQIALQPGDRLVLYSDGLTDVMAPDRSLFDLKRLTALFQTYAGLPPDTFCTSTFAALADFRGGADQHDDMTLLVVDV